MIDRQGTEPSLCSFLLLPTCRLGVLTVRHLSLWWLSTRKLPFEREREKRWKLSKRKALQTGLAKAHRDKEVLQRDRRLV